eukprot:jgi/Mesvir1/1506/Mv14489-RA.1
MARKMDAMAAAFSRIPSWPIDKKFVISEDTAQRLLAKPEKIQNCLPTESEAKAACIFGAFVRSPRVSLDGWEGMTPTMTFFEALGRFAKETGMADEKACELIKNFYKHTDFWRCVFDHYSSPEFHLEGQLHLSTMAHVNFGLNVSTAPVVVDMDSYRGLVICKEMPERSIFYQVFLYVNNLLFVDLKVPDFHTDFEDMEDSDPVNAFSGTWPGYFWFKGVRAAVRDEKLVKEFRWMDAHPDWRKQATRDFDHSFRFVRYPQSLLDWLNQYREELSDHIYKKYSFLPKEEGEDVFFTVFNMQDWPTLDWEQDLEPWVEAAFFEPPVVRPETSMMQWAVEEFVKNRCDVGEDKLVSIGDVRKSLFVDFMKKPKLANGSVVSTACLSSWFQGLGFEFVKERTVVNGRRLRGHFLGFDIKKQ